MTVLVVSAFEPELTRFRELAPTWITAEPVGIGLVECAIATTELVARHSPSEVVFLGTCGSASPRLTIGDVVVATSVKLVAGAGADLVGPSELRVPTEPSLFSALATAGAKPVRIANTLGVTTAEDLAAYVASHGDVEHLEAYAFVRACSRANLACAVVLGIANEVGAKGREQWNANHVAASARAAEVLGAALTAQRSCADE